jgi:hypothetical protein
MARRWLDLGVGARVLLIMGPALIAGWAIRQPMHLTGWAATRDLLRVGLQTVYDQRITTNPAWWLVHAFVASLGLYWVLAIYGWRHGGRLWWLLVPVFGQFALGADWSRFALYAFPVVIPVASVALWTHLRRVLLLILVAIQSLAVFADVATSGTVPLYDQRSFWISGAVMVLAAVVLWWPVRPSSGVDLELVDASRVVGGLGRHRDDEPRVPGGRGDDAVGRDVEGVALDGHDGGPR